MCSQSPVFMKLDDRPRQREFDLDPFIAAVASVPDDPIEEDPVEDEVVSPPVVAADPVEDSVDDVPAQVRDDPPPDTDAFGAGLTEVGDGSPTDEQESTNTEVVPDSKSSSAEDDGGSRGPRRESGRRRPRRRRERRSRRAEGDFAGAAKPENQSDAAQVAPGGTTQDSTADSQGKDPGTASRGKSKSRNRRRGRRRRGRGNSGEGGTDKPAPDAS